MLTNVHITNLALIKEADIDYKKGLNIMTGETGSGKSILIGAINIALGAKANKGMIRRDQQQALVELKFSNLSESVCKALSELDIEPEDDSILITRKIGHDSSLTRINGENVTLSNLKKITSLLVDVHGQHEHQSLLNTASHLEIVDTFAGEAAKELRLKILTSLEAYRKLRKDYASFDKDEETLAREIDLLTHEQNEILAANLQPEEDEKLEAEYKKLESSGQILKSVSRAGADLDDEANGIRTRIQDALKHVNEALVLDEDLKEAKTMLTDLDSIAKDLSGSLSHYIERNQFDAERHHMLSERLDLINHLKNRYGNSISEILSYADQVSEKLESYTHYTEQKEALLQQLRTGAKELNVLSGRLSEVRKEAAKRLEPLIIDQLKDLNFLDARFQIDFQKAEKITGNGYDKVEFLISTNPGESLAPLIRVASGGELSRIMLAIKSAAAIEEDIPTLIFDEIDTGISGFTAQKVAEKLHHLSKKHQIICITHLPQIAAMADHHYQIHKAVEDGSTISGIEELGEDQMLEEIARMTGGAEITEAALTHARELKQSAKNLS